MSCWTTSNWCFFSRSRRRRSGRMILGSFSEFILQDSRSIFDAAGGSLILWSPRRRRSARIFGPGRLEYSRESAMCQVWPLWSRRSRFPTVDGHSEQLRGYPWGSSKDILGRCPCPTVSCAPISSEHLWGAAFGHPRNHVGLSRCEGKDGTESDCEKGEPIISTRSNDKQRRDRIVVE